MPLKAPVRGYDMGCTQHTYCISAIKVRVKNETTRSVTVQTVNANECTL